VARLLRLPTTGLMVFEVEVVWWEVEVAEV